MKFNELVGSCTEEELWKLIEHSMDPKTNAELCDEIKNNTGYFEDDFMDKMAIAETKPKVYTLQWLNMGLCSAHLTPSFVKEILLSSANFERMVRNTLVVNFDSQFFKFYLMFSFNFLKQQLKVDPTFIAQENLLATEIYSPNFLHYTIPMYFVNYKATDHDEDMHYEWIIKLYDLLMGYMPTDCSLMEWLIAFTPSQFHPIIYDFYIIHIDERIKCKNSYSLVADMPATLLDADEDFSNRIDKTNNTSRFSITQSDVRHALRTFDAAAETTRLLKTLDTAHSMIKMFIGISFIGRYNTALQDMILDGHKFLGKLSELLKTICTAKLKKDDRFRRPELCSNIIRLASNLVHANVEAQNFLLKTHYLPFYLSQTNREEDDLYAKEVTIVFVRYMTEGNHAAREYIKQLKVDDFISENANFVKKFDDI